MLLWPAALLGQGADILYGQVRGRGGEPLVGARVEATSIFTHLTLTQVTGRDGRYLIVFPDGGGAYLLRVSHLGQAEEVLPVLRYGFEEVLITNVTLIARPIQLDGLVVSVSAPWREVPEESSLLLSKDVLDRLPLTDGEPETVALLNAGVIGTDPDPGTDRARFSVGGMREELNQVTLDGVSLGEVELGVPR
jgi:hypothetical protein